MHYYDIHLVFKDGAFGSFVFVLVLGILPRALHMLGKCFISDLSQPKLLDLLCFCFLNFFGDTKV
jgi:hypothetical protein